MSLYDYLQTSQAGQFIELYVFTVGQTVYYFTSYEKNYTYNIREYTAIPIETKGFSADTQMKPTPLAVSMGITEPVIQYIANVPVEKITLTITRVLLSNPAESIVFYSGRVMSVTIDEKGISLNCESKTDIFRQKLPRIIHSSVCNNILFDSNCKLLEGAYTSYANLTGVSGNILTSSTFGSHAGGYYFMGKCRTSYGDVRLITDHSGNNITLQLPFDSRVAVGSVVAVTPGCDRARSTCETKFGNLANYLGMPEIPSHNPAVWGVEGTRQ